MTSQEPRHRKTVEPQALAKSLRAAAPSARPGTLSAGSSHARRPQGGGRNPPEGPGSVADVLVPARAPLRGGLRPALTSCTLQGLRAPSSSLSPSGGREQTTPLLLRPRESTRLALGGAWHFVAAGYSDWNPTHEHFPLSKRDGGHRTVDNSVLAHRLCNRIGYSIAVGRSHASDLERIRRAREGAAAYPARRIAND